METPDTISLSLQKGEWVLPHSHKSEVQKMPQISPQQNNLPVHLSYTWFGNGPIGIHHGGQRGKTYGSS